MTEPQARRVEVTRRGSASGRTRVRPEPPTRDPVYICRCGQPAVLGWSRRATEAELVEFVAQGRVQPGEEATVPVFGCETHCTEAVRDKAGMLHEAKCTAPPACNCAPVVVQPSDPTFPKSTKK